MPVQSRNISIRLHPSDEHEAKAIEILDRLNAEGFSNRQIITDALLRADGVTPDMFRQGGDGISVAFLLERIEGMLTNAVKEMLEAMPTHVRKQTVEASGAEDDDEYARNLAKSYIARSGGKRK